MWELDCEESWVPKNWCFWTVVLEKILESPLDCKEIQPVHPKGDQSWVFIGRTDAEAVSPILWPPHARVDSLEKTLMLGGTGSRRRRGRQDEMAGWHHRLDGHEFESTPGVGDGQGGLACCNSWGRKESDTTERLNWTELNIPLCICTKIMDKLPYPFVCWWASRLLPGPGNYKQCCDEHWGACVSFRSGFLGVYAQEWDCWVIWQLIFICSNFYWLLWIYGQGGELFDLNKSLVREIYYWLT